MLKENVKLKKLNEEAIIPTYGSAFSAGADLYDCLEGPITIQPKETIIVKT